MKLLLMFSVIFLYSCSSLQNGSQLNKMDANVLYKKDMILNGHIGVAVFPEKDVYDFHVEARGNLDLFEMTTCHQEQSKEKAWNVKQTISSGLFGWGSKTIDKTREVNFQYKPTPIEKAGDCSMSLRGYDKNGMNSEFLALFESKAYTLKAEVACNGENKLFNGVGVCQSMIGNFQSLTFSRDVEVSSNCSIGAPNKIGKYFEIPLSKEICEYVFIGIKAPEEYFHFVTYGYDKTMLRE